MSALDKHFKSLIKAAADDGTVNIKLHIGEITALMACLDFAHRAARVITETELRQGTQHSARKMTKIQKDSVELASILADHLDIGEPENDNVN